MNREVKNQFEQADWGELTRKLAVYIARRFSTIYGKSSPQISLAGGASIEDIVQETIQKALDGSRNWDPSRATLWQFLEGIARSTFSHHHEKKETQLRSSIAIGSGNETDQNSKTTLSIDPASPNPSPENIVIARDNLKNLFNRLKDEVEDDDSLLVLFCLEEGIVKPADISQNTGLDISRIYNIRRNIKIIIDHIHEENDKNK